MKYLIFFLLFLSVFSIVVLASNIDNIIEIQLISADSSQSYYAIFFDSTKNFIFYDKLY